MIKLYNNSIYTHRNAYVSYLYNMCTVAMGIPPGAVYSMLPQNVWHVLKNNAMRFYVVLLHTGVRSRRKGTPL